MSNMTRRSIRRRPLAALMLGLGFAASAGLAGAAEPLSLTDQPIYVGGGVAPNLLLSFDDSDSLLSYVTDESSTPCDLLVTSWPGYNGLAYDPTVTYEVPPNADGSPRALPSFTRAYGDGFNPDAPQAFPNGMYGEATIDLSRQYVQFSIASPCFDTPQRAYYATGTSRASLRRVVVSDAEEQNFANWYSFYRNRLLALKSATALSFVRARIGGFRLAWQAFNHDRDGNAFDYSTSPDRVGPTARYDYATREKLLKWLYNGVAPLGNTPTIATTTRAGEYFSLPVGSGPNVVLPGDSGKEAQCRANYNLTVTDGIWNDDRIADAVPDADGTAVTLPASDLPDPLEVGSYDPSSADAALFRGPVRSLADVTFHYWSRDLLPSEPNRVPPVMVDPSDDPTSAIWNPANDPASWQHMVNHVVTFATVQSSPSPTSAEDLMRLRRGELTWPGTDYVTSSTERDNARALDTWHATMNSRGSLLEATRPAQVADRLASLLDSFVQSASRTAPVSLATGQVGGDGVAYQVTMNSTGWSGDLIAYATNADGTQGAAQWSAACTLTGGTCDLLSSDVGAAKPAPDARVLLTMGEGRKTGVPLRWASLSARQKRALSLSPVTGRADALGPARVDWLRGERNAEQAAGGVLRTRDNVLGAIVDSQPVVVSRPIGAYPDTWPGSAPENAAGNAYSAFVAAKQARETMIYVGADDGMMHAFDTSGVERFAYAPDAALPTVPTLADPQFIRAALMRATPMVRDAFVGGRWRTVLVSAMGRGGRGLFALDVTDPHAVTETTPNLLWDRTDIATGTGTHADVGFIYGAPYIARLADGRWWAISGNGYNSPNGKAALVMVRLEDGHVHVLRTGDVVDPLSRDRANGLSTAVVSDLDRDGISEFAFAGDVYGNVWRFDLTDSSIGKWKVSGAGGDGPIFTARGPEGEYQPITVAPRLLRGQATNRLVLLFGTGKTIEYDDMQPGRTPKQSIYGLFDVATTTGISRADLATRTLALGESIGDTRVRTVSGSPVGDAPGWVIDLDTDERVNTAAVPRGNVVFVPTLVAKSDDPCRSQFSSWLMTLAADTGLAPHALDGAGNARPMSALDLDGDGAADAGDLGSNTGGIAGVAFDEPILGLTIAASAPVPGRVDPLCDTAIVAGPSGNTALASACFAPQRVGWRQLLPH